jgi:hypothetical protein
VSQCEWKYSTKTLTLKLKKKKVNGIEGLEDLGKNQKDMKISGGIKADNKQFEDMNLNIEKSWKAATRARMWPITAQPQKRRKLILHVPEHGLLNSQK